MGVCLTCIILSFQVYDLPVRKSLSIFRMQELTGLPSQTGHFHISDGYLLLIFIFR